MITKVWKYAECQDIFLSLGKSFELKDLPDNIMGRLFDIINDRFWKIDTNESILIIKPVNDNTVIKERIK